MQDYSSSLRLTLRGRPEGVHAVTRRTNVASIYRSTLTNSHDMPGLTSAIYAAIKSTSSALETIPTGVSRARKGPFF